MNNRSIISTPGDRSREIVVDEYLPAANEGTGDSGFQIDATWLRGALYRQRWLIGATILGALLIGLIATLLATPIYQARASTRVQPMPNMMIPGAEMNAPIGSSNEIDRLMLTYQSIVQTRNLAVIVAQNLNPATRMALLGDDFAENRPEGASDEAWEATTVQRAANVLRSNVATEIPFETQIVNISYSSEDPAVAAEVANQYAEAFIQSDVRTNVDRNTYSREYLEEQIQVVRAQLDDAERASNAYARGTGIVTTQTTGTDGEGGQTITGANLSSINQTVAMARADRISAEQKWRAAEAVPAAQLPAVQQSPVYQNLTSQRAQLVGERSDLLQRYNSDFPAIQDINARIATLESQIAETARNIKAGIRNEFVIARNQENALEGELADATSDALVEQDQNVEFQGLQREAEALRLQLTDLLDRYNMVSTSSNVRSGTITLLDGATVPSQPVSPNLPRNMLIATVIGLALAGGLALVREIFVDQFRRAEDIEDRLGIPVLGLTPYVESKDIDHSDVNQFSALMEAYASIRSTIDVSVPREGAVVQLTSSGPSEGKSTTALILSELFARLGRRTLLIDADFRKPSIVKLLELEQRKAGMAEVLLGHAEFEDAVIEGAHENLHVLSTATTPPNPVELLSSQRFRDFIEEQREKYSLIMIDSSPVLGLADAPEIAQVADSTIFVIEANRTTLNQAKTSLRRLENVGATVIGAVLTKYRALEAGVDYNYQYQYYQYGDATK
ncbi:GumC family protein [Erythrobacter sp.]|uniref:GumC family protein n=1 Tax=Erythrobacter sp. TaxID=1042 RepID=UPI003C731885